MLQAHDSCVRDISNRVAHRTLTDPTAHVCRDHRLKLLQAWRVELTEQSTIA